MKYAIIILSIPLVLFIITAGVVHYISSLPGTESSSTRMLTCTKMTSGEGSKESCSYKSFKGTKRLKSIKLKEGQTYSAKYDIDLISGDLQLTIIDQDKTIVWTQGSEMNGNIDFKASKEGEYNIMLSSSGSEGRYTIIWNQ